MAIEKRLCILLLLSLVVLSAARPQEFDEDEDSSHDAHDGDKKDDVGRVQIKVYRGPTKHDGYAPWGFWVKQPADD